MSDVDGLRETLAHALCFNREAGYVTVATADLVAVVDRMARQRAAEELRAAASAIDDDRRVSEARDLGQAQRVAGEARSVVLEHAAALSDDGQP